MKKTIEHFIKKNYIYIILFVFVTIFFFSLVKKAAIIFFLIFFSWFIKSYQKKMPFYLGIDLVLLSTVLTSYSYGFFIGTLTGFASMFVSSLWRGRFNPLTLTSYLIIALIALIIPLFSTTNISLLGIIITLFYDTLFLFLSIGFFDGRISRGLTFAISHLFFNIFLFLKVAPKLLGFM
ncbi:hypothetical protein C0585_00260 [Candidatus Woesearchaeota archaeon]|nr:MAG: hypothetical protein C0585_00260 [Candidatus Woesearchaeota archaeon]